MIQCFISYQQVVLDLLSFICYNILINKYLDNYTSTERMMAMKKIYTKEERAEYFKALRERWTLNKAQSLQDTAARAKNEAIQKKIT